MNSHYYQPDTWVLRNLLGKTDRESLRSAEDEVVVPALATLSEAELPDSYSWELLSAIHLWLFRDVYEWAGQLRTEGIRKGDTYFVPPESIRPALDAFFVNLAEVELPVPSASFVDRFAKLYAELNHVHPFMEGNGRAQRAFWEPWCEQAGHRIDWTGVSKHENDEASARAELGDLSPLRAIVTRIATL